MGPSQGNAPSMAAFIKDHYSGRVIEVGCGRRSYVAFSLAPFLDVVATDVLEGEAVDECIRPLYVKDDIMSPDLRRYHGAQLLYSIRPPLEIQHGILKTALIVHADVLIRPLGGEIIEDLQGYLSNFRGIAFYYYRFEAAVGGREQRRLSR